MGMIRNPLPYPTLAGRMSSADVIDVVRQLPFRHTIEHGYYAGDHHP